MFAACNSGPDAQAPNPLLVSSDPPAVTSKSSLPSKVGNQGPIGRQGPQGISGPPGPGGPASHRRYWYDGSALGGPAQTAE